MKNLLLNFNKLFSHRRPIKYFTKKIRILLDSTSPPTQIPNAF